MNMQGISQNRGKEKNNLLTASLQHKVSNLKSLSEAFKDIEKKNTSGSGLKLEVNGTATFGLNTQEINSSSDITSPN